jgi:glycosyltransferase involved in cell wall biosynthesis
MKKIEFIIPTYNRPDKLMIVLLSIKTQTDDRWSVHVVADAQYEGYENVKEYFKNDEKFRFSELNGPHNDWGHTARNYGLQNTKEYWVVMSGDDNYYTPLFVETFLNVVRFRNDVNFVYCNMVHNWVNNDYIPIASAPKVGRIDIGNFMTKSEFAKQLKLDVTKAIADGLFVEEYINKFKSDIIQIQKFLYVHN